MASSNVISSKLLFCTKDGLYSGVSICSNGVILGIRSGLADLRVLGATLISSSVAAMCSGSSATDSAACSSSVSACCVLLCSSAESRRMRAILWLSAVRLFMLNKRFRLSSWLAKPTGLSSSFISSSSPLSRANSWRHFCSCFWRHQNKPAMAASRIKANIVQSMRSSP